MDKLKFVRSRSKEKISEELAEDRKKTLEKIPHYQAIKAQLKFKEQDCDYDDSNAQYKADLDKYKLSGGVKDEEYEDYKAKIKLCEYVNLLGIDRDINFHFEKEGVANDALLNLFFCYRNGNVHKRNEEELNSFVGKFSELRNKISEAKDVDAIEGILEEKHGKDEQTLVVEILEEALSRRTDDIKKLPFALYKWIILAESFLIETQIKFINPHRLGETFKPLTYQVKTRKELLFSNVKPKKLSEKADNYTLIAQDIVTPVIRCACLEQLEMLRKTGQLNVALTRPAMAKFVSKYDPTADFSQDMLSRVQLAKAQALDYGLVKRRERGGGKGIKITMREETSSGKTHLKNLLEERFKKLEVVSLNLNSSKEERDKYFKGEHDLAVEDGKDLLIVLDEATFYTKYFRDAFLPDAKDKNYGLMAAGKSHEQLGVEIIEIERAGLAMQRKLLKRGANLFILGASESVDKVRHAECVRLDVELFEEQQKLENKLAEVEELKVLVKANEGGTEGLEKFWGKFAKDDKYKKSTTWARNDGEKAELIGIVKKLHAAKILKDEDLDHLIGGAESEVFLGIAELSLRLKICQKKDTAHKVAALSNIVQKLLEYEIIEEGKKEELSDKLKKGAQDIKDVTKEIRDSLEGKRSEFCNAAKLIGTDTAEAVRVIEGKIGKSKKEAGADNIAKLYEDLEKSRQDLKKAEEEARSIRGMVDKREEMYKARLEEANSLQRSQEGAKLKFENIDAGNFSSFEVLHDQGLASFVENFLPVFEREQNQRVQYILPDFYIDQKTCTGVSSADKKDGDEKTDLEKIQEKSKADIIIVPHLIVNETDHSSEMGCRVYYRNDTGGFVLTEPMTLKKLDGDKGKGEESEFEKIAKKFANPNILSFFCGPSGDGKCGGNVVGGNYSTSGVGTTEQIIQLKSYESHGWRDWLQWKGRNRGAGAESINTKIIVAGDENGGSLKNKIKEKFDSNEEVYDQIHTLAHLQLKLRDSEEDKGDEDEDRKRKASRNRRILEDYVSEEDGKPLKIKRNDPQSDNYRESITFNIEEKRKEFKHYKPLTIDVGGELEKISERSEEARMEGIVRAETMLANVDHGGETSELTPSQIAGLDRALAPQSSVDDVVIARALSEEDGKKVIKIKECLERYIRCYNTIDHEDFLEISSNQWPNRIVTSEILRFVKSDVVGKEESKAPFYMIIDGELFEKDFDSRNMRFVNLEFHQDAKDRWPIFCEDLSLGDPSFTRCEFKGVDFGKVEDFHAWKFYGCTFTDCILPEVVKESQFAASGKGSNRKECEFFKSIKKEMGIKTEGAMELLDINNLSGVHYEQNVSKPSTTISQRKGINDAVERVFRYNVGTESEL